MTPNEFREAQLAAWRKFYRKDESREESEMKYQAWLATLRFIGIEVEYGNALSATKEKVESREIDPEVLIAIMRNALEV